VGVRDEKCYTCGRVNPGLWGFAPLLRKLGTDLGFVPLVIGGSAVLYVLTLLASGSQIQIVGGGLSILAPSNRALRMFGESGAIPVFIDGYWWTLLSASWLHGHFIHILFNMMWVRDLGPTMVDLVGAPRTIIIYVLSGAVGFLFSAASAWFGLPIPFLGGAAFTVGASASIFGLLGALVHYGRKSGSSLIHGQALNYAILLFVMGLIMPGIDNTAHAGGFIGGYATSALFKPLTREKGDHMLIAVICLVATVISIVLTLFYRM
jgi:rhomboid protease GluP